MLDNCDSNGTTAAGNFKHPTATDCNSWVAQAWKELRMDGVRKKAAELGMAADPGAEIVGFQDTVFEDVQPSGAEEDFGDPELRNQLLAIEQEL